MDEGAGGTEGLMELSDVVRPFAGARGLPARAYVDPAVFVAERARIFERSWICVGREDEVPRAGDFLVAKTDDAGILVVRGHDLVLRAFRNVCVHRGTPLADAEGRCEAIVCPYHGWTFDLAGVGKSPSDARGRSLREVSVATFRGFAFVRLGEGAPFDDRAPPWLKEALLGQLRRVGRTEHEVAANWKLLVENFQESHHFSRVHPGLELRTPNEMARTWLGDGAWLGGTMELADGQETVSRSGRREGRPLLLASNLVHDAMMFPTLLTSLQPDYLLTYRLFPRAVDRTVVIADTYFHPAADGDASDVLEFWAEVNAEDRAICERQQRGMASGHHLPGPYASCEDGVHAFDVRVARALAGDP